MSENKEKQKEITEARVNIYGLLSAIYRKEITSEFLQKLTDERLIAALTEMAVDFSDLFEKDENQLIEDLAVEYCRLFIGPGPHISPYESVYHGTFTAGESKGGLLWGNETIKVKKFYEQIELTVPKDAEINIPDHIAVELEVMQYLCNKELDSKGNGESRKYLEMEKEFLDKHIIKWVPRFCDNVTKSARIKFYKDIAILTKRFIKADKKLVDELISI